MLTEISIKTAKNLGKIFLSNNKLLIPKKNTLLNEFFKFSYDSNLIIENEEMIEDIIKEISTGKEVTKKQEKFYINSDHDALLDNYVTDLTSIFSNQILFARNIVNKDMQQFITNLESYLNSYNPKEPEEFFKIRYFKLHPIFRSELMNEINSINKSLYDLEHLNLSSVLDSNFNIKEYLKTYDEELDSLILEFLVSIEERKNIISLITENIKEYELDIPDLLEYSLVNYLFYRALTEKTDLKLGLSVMDLRSKSNVNKIVFSNKVKNALKLYETTIRNGKILSSNSETNFSFLNEKTYNLVIYDENFEKLSNKDIPLEAIFGYIVDSNSNDLDIATLEKNKDYYLDKWSKLKSLYMINLNKNRINIIKQYIKMEYDKLINKVYEEIVSKDDELKLTRDYYVKKANEKFDCFLANLNNENLEDTNWIGLEVVAASVYWFSNAYELLKEMNDIINTVDNITPNEAAMYSSIKYLTNFLLDQVEVVKI